MICGNCADDVPAGRTACQSCGYELDLYYNKPKTVRRGGSLLVAAVVLPVGLLICYAGLVYYQGAEMAELPSRLLQDLGLGEPVVEPPGEAPPESEPSEPKERPQGHVPAATALSDVDGMLAKQPGLAKLLEQFDGVTGPVAELAESVGPIKKVAARTTAVASKKNKNKSRAVKVWRWICHLAPRCKAANSGVREVSRMAADVKELQAQREPLGEAHKVFFDALEKVRREPSPSRMQRVFPAAEALRDALAALDGGFGLLGEKAKYVVSKLDRGLEALRDYEPTRRVLSVGRKDMLELLGPLRNAVTAVRFRIPEVGKAVDDARGVLDEIVQFADGKTFVE